MTTTAEAIREIVKRLRAKTRHPCCMHSVDEPDAQCQEAADALEQVLEAVEEAERVIDALLPYATVVIHSTDDAHERDVLRAAAEWQRKHGTHGGSK